MTDQSKAAPAPPSLAGGEVRDLSGETVMGMRVAAYRHPASCPPDLDKSEWLAFFNGSPPNTYCEHWSTPGEHRTDVERLFTEADVRRAIAALSPEAPARGEAAIWAKVEEAARRYARCYPEASDGRNTFVMFADWAASEALTPRHEAPAEGAGEADVLVTMRDHYQFALTGPWPDIKTPNYALAGLFKMAGDEIEHLRARSSAPEARDADH